MEIRDNPHNSILVFTWGGRLFLMPRIPGDIPRVELPDWKKHMDWLNDPQRLKEYFDPKVGWPQPKPRHFCRVSLDGGDCPIYIEVQP